MINAHTAPYAALALRVGLGAMFVAHSLWLKLFVFTLPGTAQFFASIGLPPALAYVVFALFGASLVALFAVLPPSLIMLVAGLGLLGALANALAIALKDEKERIAATVTFAVTASGLTLFGVGSAFWGLVAGLVVLFLDRIKVR